ncbi:RNA-binding domain-containing protein [Xylona heveae TC161]|uniref:RNA-binding domain-containing protein n=1 Tax=Xylona heveae (strain CBS 132557 / TC161) TaxID=1328760 RepID=A0A165I547_XYLHT|nr:RNA-binding domain-containing protein [Xylona heveae TC161]KZF24399.1 RNA-binding domain-containing protein [Xylona heveae TC161]
MSYPPPPGLKSAQQSISASSTPPPHASLPPRPPPPAAPLSNFKPAFSSTPSFLSGATGSRPGTNGAATPVGTFTGFRPRTIANNQSWRSYSPTVSAPPTPVASTVSTTPASGYATAGYPTNSYAQVQTPYYQTPQDAHAHATPPQIQNPFPAPGRGNGNARYHESGADPEMEAQIAQWQSAYTTREAEPPGSKSGVRGTTRFGEGSAANTGGQVFRIDSGTAINTDATTATTPDSAAAPVALGPDGKQKTVVRSGGGQVWQDSSLLEWDPAHFRFFVGNLAGEVTDDSLLKAFSKYPSVQKARVVRDKRTTKSKGFGFVSFSDGDEYFRAAREMQGKYVGSHPILLRRSTTEIRPTAPGSNKGGKHGKGGQDNKQNGSGAKTGAGIQKKQSKTKGGLRIIG